MDLHGQVFDIINLLRYGSNWTMLVPLTLGLRLLYKLFFRLRAPKAPDPEADMGDHKFSYAFMPHEGNKLFFFE